MDKKSLSLSYLDNIKPYHGYYKEDIKSIDCR